MKLLVDIGNTRLKWTCFQANELAEIVAITHKDQEIKQALLQSWALLQEPEALYLSVVSSKQIRQLVFSVAGQLWPHMPVQEIQTQAQANGVRNAYPRPEKLGVDRWLALLGAYHYYILPVCIVDCGTAITLDILDQQGQHQGGTIMPGLRLMQQLLQQGTENLNSCSKVYPRGLANDTEAAIFNGNLNAIKGFIELACEQYNKPLQLLMTGGDAEFIADSLDLKAIVDTRLIFKGLIVSSCE